MRRTTLQPMAAAARVFDSAAPLPLTRVRPDSSVRLRVVQLELVHEDSPLETAVRDYCERREPEAR